MIKWKDSLVRSVIKMHATMAQSWIAKELGVTNSFVDRTLTRVRNYPQRIAQMEAEIKEMRYVFNVYLASERERRLYTKFGKQRNGDFCMGKKIIPALLPKTPREEQEAADKAFLQALKREEQRHGTRNIR